MRRGLHKDFLAAMREKLERGRQMGRSGWDTKWNCSWHTSEIGGPTGWMMDRLRHEVAELTVALQKGDSKTIRSEAADVANFAMFVADFEGALKL